MAYVLGANNIGLIYGSTVVSSSNGQADLEVILLLVLAGIFGMITLGRSALGGVMGDRMLTLSPQGVFAAFISSALVVWVGTQYGLPVSISQCLLGGMIGAALSRSISAVNVRLVSETLSLWVVAPVVAFALSGLLVGLL